MKNSCSNCMLFQKEKPEIRGTELVDSPVCLIDKAWQGGKRADIARTCMAYIPRDREGIELVRSISDVIAPVRFNTEIKIEDGRLVADGELKEDKWLLDAANHIIRRKFDDVMIDELIKLCDLEVIE